MSFPEVVLRHARAMAGLTQSEVAARAGLTQSAIARLERPGSNPTVATLERVLAASGCYLSLSAERYGGALDEQQIAERLRLSPAERLAAFTESHRALNELRAKARRIVE